MPTVDRLYEPDASANMRLGAEVGPEGLLFVGQPDEDLVSIWRSNVPDIRYVDDKRASRDAQLMPSGIYLVKEQGRWIAVVPTTAGQQATRARRASKYELAGDLDPLVLAADFVADFWELATALTEEDVLARGTNVLINGTNDFGTVIAHQRISGTVQYTLDVRGVRKQVSAGNVQALPGDISDPSLWLSLPPATAAELALTVAWTKVHHPLSDVLYSFGSSRTLFRPYQFKPILKMMQADEHRILIADEVGLGKTIEAGLIWAELEGRSPLDRVLVLCPAAITLKWQTEMQLRFDRKLDLLGKSDWDKFLTKCEKGEQPAFFGVDSIERLRVTDVPERLVTAGVRFDLVIIDEGHKLRNPATMTHEMGQALADASDAFVLLSATPVNLGNKDLFTLLRLLDGGRFNDFGTFLLESEPNARINQAITMVATGGTRPREIREHLLQLQHHELGQAILDRPDTQVLLGLLDKETPLDAAGISSAKRTLSALGFFSSFITRTRKIEVPDAKALREAHTLSVVFTEEERRFYDAVRAWIARRAEKTGAPPGFAEQMPLRQTASCIPAMAQRFTKGAGKADIDYLAELDESDKREEILVPELNLPVPRVDSKFDQLLVAITKIRESGLRQAMVFSYFRLTLGYLEMRLLEQGFSCRVMHGGVHIDEREKIMRDFRQGEFDLLLLSEVGSEGLDFEFCGALVNYDLPWNPMKVEQRIGRLDRFGQQHEKILIFNFTVEGTIEDRILMKLFERIGVFKQSIGDLEPIISAEIDEITDLLLDVRLSQRERETRMHEIEVALASKEELLEDLRSAEGDLTQLDRVLIDGFEADNPGRGRFVGPRELVLLLQDLLARSSGELKSVDDDGWVTLQGSAPLASQVREFVRGTTRYVGPLIQQVQDAKPFRLALSPEAASTAQTLLSVKHPLIRIAVNEIAKDPLGLKRFGHISLKDRPTEQYFALLSLVQGQGVRPFLRLDPVVVDLNGRHVPEAGDRLLQAFATGEYTDGRLARPRNLVDLYFDAQRLADAERIASELELQLYTASLVSSRKVSLEHSTSVKLAATRAALRSASDARIIRMHEGRIRNLQAHLRDRLSELDHITALATSETAALVLVDA